MEQHSHCANEDEARWEDRLRKVVKRKPVEKPE